MVLLFLSSAVFAQNYQIDSLKQELGKKDLPDSTRMTVLLDLGEKLIMNDAPRSRQYYLRCYKMAQESSNRYFMGLAVYGIGSIYHYKQDYDSAMYFYLTADSILNLDHSALSREAITSVKSLMADVERNKNNFEKAIALQLEAVSIQEKSGNWNALGVTYSNIGNIYYDMGQYSRTLEYDLKSLEAHKKDGMSKYGIASAELFVAGDYIALNRLPEAKSHIENAERIAKETNSTVLFNGVYGYWGTYYRATKEYHKAIQSLGKAVVYAQKIQDTYHEMDAYRIMGYVYAELKDYNKSLLFLNKALTRIKQLKNRLLEVGTLKKMAEVQSALGNNGEAVILYASYISLYDSLNRETTKVKISEVENKFQNKQKADSILVLQKNSQLQQLALKKKETQNIFIITAACLLLVAGLLFYRDLRNKHHLLAQSNQIHEQQIIQLEKERQLIAAQSLMKGQEEERSRLAKDLHDGVGGLLSGVKLSLSNMKGNVFLSEENARAVNMIIGQLDNSITELRRVSHNMMPEALIKFGLREALENYCENIDQAGELKVRLQTYGLDHRMEQDTEIVIYRIVQELLNNVVKHAEAKQVLVQLIREQEKFTLTVEDDGKGFNLADPKAQKGAGLQNIKARAGYLNGIVDVRTRPGEGTSITIEGRLS
jgi:signal transduction histidine kinase